MNMFRPGAFNPAARGYHATYRDHEINHCPGCGRTQWFVGRVTAECGFCATALPLACSDRQPPSAIILQRGKAVAA